MAEPVIRFSSTSSTVIAHALSLAGLVVSSQYLLAKWQATQSLIVPTQPPIAEEKPKEEPEQPQVRLSLWRRMTKSVWFRTLWPASLAVTVEAIALYLVPKYGKGWMLDLFWGCVEFAMNMAVFTNAMAIVLPLPIEISYQPTPSSTSVALAFRQIENPTDASWTDNIWARRLIALSLTSSCFVAAVIGQGWISTLPSCLAAAGWVMWMSQYHFRMVKMRKLVVGVLVAWLAMAAAFGCLLAVFWLFNIPTHGPPPADHAKPSEWMLRLMLSLTRGFAYIPGTFLLSASLRYDRRHDSISASKSEIVPMPRALPPVQWSRSPTFVVALVALAISAAVCEVIGPDTELGPLDGPLIAIPITCGLVAGSIWLRGEWAEWWAYEEVWEPASLSPAATAVEGASEKGPVPADEL